MKAIAISLVVCVVLPGLPLAAREGKPMDIIHTSNGDLQVAMIGHGSLMLVFGDIVMHIDPWTRQADYTQLPKADIILITHEHPDHLDLSAIKILTTDVTRTVVNRTSGDKVIGSMPMANGEVRTIRGIRIEAVPAYNVVHMRGPGQPYHPKGVGNGYVLTFADQKVYVAGDTENTPEMKSLEDIECAFLPMNMPYTMTPEMVADAAKSIKPKILYPYHYGETDTNKLVQLLEGTGIDIRIR